MIICGKCKAKHATVTQVKACYNVTPVFAAELDLKTPEFVAAIQAKEATEDAAAYASKAMTVVAVLDKPNPVTLPGMYTKNGQVFRVKSSKAGYLYAQLVTMFDGKPTYTFSQGTIKTLCADDKMTIEAAEAYSLKIGHCCCCGKELTNLKSVALGIGPVCRKKYF